MSDTVLEEYSEAYAAIHGKPPKIQRRGSWLAIGDGPDWATLKVRKSDLPAMTSQLRLSKKEPTS